MGRSAGRNAGFLVPGQVEAPGLLRDSDAVPRMAALCPKRTSAQAYQASGKCWCSAVFRHVSNDSRATSLAPSERTA